MHNVCKPDGWIYLCLASHIDSAYQGNVWYRKDTKIALGWSITHPKKAPSIGRMIHYLWCLPVSIDGKTKDMIHLISIKCQIREERNCSPEISVSPVMTKKRRRMTFLGFSGMDVHFQLDECHPTCLNMWFLGFFTRVRSWTWWSWWFLSDSEYLMILSNFIGLKLCKVNSFHIIEH